MTKRTIYLFLLSFVIFSCKKETKEVSKTIVKTQKNGKKKIADVPATVYKDYTTAPVDFFDDKYKTEGFQFNDGSLSYTFSDENLGSFMVTYIGKSWEFRDYWDIDNSKGFFAELKKNKIDNEDKKIIGDRANQVLKRELDNYNVFVDFYPKEAILDYSNKFGELTLKKDAYRYFYIYENNEWFFVKRLLHSTIERKQIDVFTDVFLSHKLKDIKPITEKFHGKFEAGADGEYTNDGVGHTTYYFTITADKIDLKSIAYRGDFVCEGEYKGIENDDILELYYDREDHRCKYLRPAYMIKKEGDDFFIKGIGGEGTINNWIKMNIGFEE
ncbi:hypothetical protein ACFSJW_02770 [Flavobacterium artemisiae]|uniref:Lipoprotein n=1 Tax=Flavobacterium artemisiae TaxID=2126556 RepID=A0ABW4HIV5_9FLAO